MDKERADEIAAALGASVVLPVEEALGVSRELMATPLGMLAAAEGFNRRQAMLRQQAAEVVDDKKD
jgi:hypothetical protein